MALTSPIHPSILPHSEQLLTIRTLFLLGWADHRVWRFKQIPSATAEKSCLSEEQQAFWFSDWRREFCGFEGDSRGEFEEIERIERIRRWLTLEEDVQRSSLIVWICICSRLAFSLPCRFSQSLSRAGFASLACALHFLDRAEGLTQEGKKVLESQVRDKNLVEVIDEIKRLMLREESFLEKRLTPEVFLSIITHCDSKTIAASLGVNKLWKSWILESKAVFSHFEMVGNVAEIIKGIQFFGERSNHSLESVDIKIKESPTAHQREQLRISISRSSKTVKRLSIGYLRSQKFPGGAGYSEDLSQLIIDIAASCSNLLLLESYGGGADWLFDSESHPSVEFPSHFGAKLQKFIWRAGGENLVCNDTLARCLQEASEVVIWSSKIQPSWIIGLLSSNSNLVKVEFPFHSPQFVKDIPILNLPKLKRLFLYGSLYSATEDGRWFWRKLQAPSLNYLRIIQLNAKEFSSFQAPVSPIFWLDIGSIDFETQSGE